MLSLHRRTASRIAPFLVDVHLALRQFHYDVGDLNPVSFVRLVPMPEGATDLPAMLLDVEVPCQNRGALLKTMVLVVGSIPSSR